MAVADVQHHTAAQRYGYAIVLPPGWFRIPLREGTERAVEAAVEAGLTPDVPRDSTAALRAEVRRQLREAAADAARVGGIDLYLPVRRMHDVSVAASFVVSEVADAAAGEAPGAIAEVFGADAEDVVVDGFRGVRHDDVVAPDPLMSELVQVPSRRVTYVVPAPPPDPRWLVVSFSTIGDGADPRGDLAEVLVDLFDAIMGTFRWLTPDAVAAAGVDGR